MSLIRRVFINSTAVFFTLLLIYLMCVDITGNQDGKVVLNFNSAGEFWIEFIALIVFFIILIVIIVPDIKKACEELYI